MEYAGLVRRSIAVTVDSFFIGLLLYVGQVITTSPIFVIQHLLKSLDPATAKLLTNVLLVVLILILPWLYSARMTSSADHATLGKLAFGLAVVDCEGKPLTFRRASVRYWGSILSLLTVGVGFLLTIFTSRRQALHDLIAKTVVVRSPSPSRVFLRKGLHHLGAAIGIVLLEQVVLAPLLISHGTQAEVFPVTRQAARNFASMFQETPVDQTAEVSASTYTSLLHNFSISVPFDGWKIHRTPDYALAPEDKPYDVKISNTAADRIASVSERFWGGTTEIPPLTGEQIEQARVIIHKVLNVLEQKPVLKESLRKEGQRKREEDQRQYQEAYEEAMQAAKAAADASLTVMVRLSDKDIASLVNSILELKRSNYDVTIESRRYIAVDGLLGSEIVYRERISNPRFEAFLEKLRKQSGERLNRDLDQLYRERGLGQSKRERTSLEPDTRPAKNILTLLRHGDYFYSLGGYVAADQPKDLDQGIESIRQIISTFKLVDRNITSFAGFSLDRERGQKLLRDEAVADLVEAVGPAVVAIESYDRNQEQLGFGSGFLVTSSGVIVTNFHVVEGATSISITLANDDVYRGVQIIDVDRTKDVAVLKIEGKDLPSLEVGGPDDERVGERVVAIGNPLGFSNVVSDGLFNGMWEIEEGVRYILTTAPISPGSSGGPLVTMDGEVIGITTESLEEGQNLNLAVSIEEAKRLISESPKRTFADLIPRISVDDIKGCDVNVRRA